MGHRGAPHLARTLALALGVNSLPGGVANDPPACNINLTLLLSALNAPLPVWWLHQALQKPQAWSNKYNFKSTRGEECTREDWQSERSSSRSYTPCLRFPPFRKRRPPIRRRIRLRVTTYRP